MTADGSDSRALEAWRFVRTTLDTLTDVVLQDAETELELVEGLRVIARVTALSTEISVDADPQRPWFFRMNTPVRFVAGPNPDGDYHLCMIDGSHRYRIRGRRGTVAYLGFQFLAGRGLEPRRQAVYVSDRDLATGPDGAFELVVSVAEPVADELGGATWVPVPEDVSAIVVRQYLADAATEEPATFAVEPLDDPGPPPLPADDLVAEQFTALGWTIAKLATLHRTILPELIADPNRFVTASAAAIGPADTTPDNLYMIGTFRLEPDEALVIDAVPPQSRFWNLTVSNIWHECIDVGRRRSSITNAAARLSDGRFRAVVAARDPGVDNWIDTGGRHRGWMIFRWLDAPPPPEVSATVVALDDVPAAGRV